jgi:hypothetical protein
MPARNIQLRVTAPPRDSHEIEQDFDALFFRCMKNGRLCNISAIFLEWYGTAQLQRFLNSRTPHGHHSNMNE